jgi:trimeric autotransporter adhesin
MKLQFYPNPKVFLVLCAFVYGESTAQVSGLVYRDINSNGVRDLVLPSEPGEYGVAVAAYNSVNTLLATVYTDASGVYNFSAGQIPAGTPVRLEFTAPASNYPSKRIAADRSNIQFVTAGATAVNIDYAVATKKLLSDNTNPYVAGTSYTNGNALSTGAGNAGENDNLYVFPYDLSNNGGSTRRAKNQYLGAIFGLAWQRESRVLLMSAYLKRHAGFGPNGIGAIYQTQIDKNGIPSKPELLLDVSTMGINVGTDPRTSPLPAATNVPNIDNGVFSEVGRRGMGGIELDDNGRDLYIVNMFEKKLHRINIGNPIKTSFSSSDVTGEWVIPAPAIPGNSWFPMAIKMHEGKIYVGGVSVRETTTAHNIADTANMRGVVYELNVAAGSNVLTEVFRFPLTHRKGFTNADYRYEFRNNYWCAWQNSGNIALGGPLRSGLIGPTIGGNATGIYYPQAMFSALEFDVDGSMIIGLRDRFGDQGGYFNYFETGNGPGETYRTIAVGEMLRAGKSGSGFILESAGSVTSSGVTTTTPGLTDNNLAQTGSFPLMTGTPYGGIYGPGGGYYYYNQNFSLTGVPAPFNSVGTFNVHYLKTNGGLALLPGNNEIMATAIDPWSSSFSNGILKNANLGANAGNMVGRLQILGSVSGDPTNMGKAAALGDIEMLLDAHAVEIGNRVWDDVNANGRQDADEPGIAGVVVVLRSSGPDGIYNNGDDQTWTTTTDANGNYYFDGSFVNDVRRPASWLGVSSTNSGILPGFEYKLEINSVQVPLTGKLLTFANTVGDAIDNDGVYNVTNVEYIINPGGTTAANSSFANNYNIDFGFSHNALLPLKKIELSASLINDIVRLNWNTTDEKNVFKYEVERSTDGQDFSYINYMTSKGNGSYSYQVIDDMLPNKSGNLYYRLKIIDKSGFVRYTEIVYVNVKNTGKLLITPNPFRDFINLQFYGNKKEVINVGIYNAAGQMVYRKQLSSNEGMNIFSIQTPGNLPNGFYVIEVRGESILKREKILRQL